MYLIGNTVVSYYFVYWTTNGWNSRIYHSLIFMLFTFMQLKAKHTFRWKIASWKLFFVPPPPLTLLLFCPEMHSGTTWFVFYCWIPTPGAGRSLVSILFTFQICMVVYKLFKLPITYSFIIVLQLVTADPPFFFLFRQSVI